MATKPKITKPKTARSKSQTKKVKGVIASPKKRFDFSNKQWSLIGVVALAIVGAGAYFGIQYYQNTTTDAASCTSNTYKQGSSGTCVKYIQQLVNASGKASLTADGAFGAKTKTGVIAFQKSRSLTADGIVGSNTWKKLCDVSGASSAKSGAGCGGSSSSKSWATIHRYTNTSYSGYGHAEWKNSSNIKLTSGHTYRACVELSYTDKAGYIYMLGAGAKNHINIANPGTYCNQSAKQETTSTPYRFTAEISNGDRAFGFKSIPIQEYK